MEQPLLETRSKPLTNSLILATTVACMGTLQFGYHLAELNAPSQVFSCQNKVIPKGFPKYSETWVGSLGLSKCIPLEDSQIGLVTSIFSIGGLIGSFYAGSLADKFGRKRVSFGNAILAALGSFILFSSNSYTQLLVGRVICGLAAGSAIVVVPMTISEIAPPQLKGVLGSMNQVAINIGILFTQLLALKWSNTYQWRYLLLTGSFLGLANAAMLFLVSETPRWLHANGFHREAETSLFKLRRDSRVLHEEITEWSSTQTSSAISLFQYVSQPQYFNSRVVASSVMIGQQLCGINSIIFYGVKVIADLVPQYAIAINVLISALNVVMTFAGAPLIDRLGRKPLLSFSTAMMSLTSLFISWGILSGRSTILVPAVFAYIASFALGGGPIPFLIISEVTQPEAVGTAQSFGTTCLWIATFTVGFLFPMINTALGGYVYMLFSGLAALYVVFILYKVPETKGKKTYQQVWA